jgi:hypothetical protein
MSSIVERGEILFHRTTGHLGIDILALFLTDTSGRKVDGDVGAKTALGAKIGQSLGPQVDVRAFGAELGRSVSTHRTFQYA